MRPAATGSLGGHVLLCLLLPTAAAAQQALPVEFPADVSTPSAQALREHMAGKVFKAQPAKGPGWRLEYKASGYVFLDTTAGFRDTGRWHVEETRLCAQWERSPSACSEARLQGAVVYINRVSNGEVVALVPD
jgi:hypothetical protein